jgi:hypothetical protein
MILTVGLIGAVAAVVLAVAARGVVEAAALEALQETGRGVAGGRPPRHHHVAEHHQPRVPDTQPLLSITRTLAVGCPSCPT